MVPALGFFEIIKKSIFFKSAFLCWENINAEYNTIKVNVIKTCAIAWSTII